MTKHVLILGAGASVDCGGPLVNDFLDIAEDLRRGSRHQVDRSAFDRVFEGIHHLRRAQSNTQINLDNIETVFAAFQMAELFGVLGDLPAADVSLLSESLTTLIVQTIESRIWFSSSAQGSLMPPPTYSELAKIARRMEQTGDPLTIITFNYDVALDFALEQYGAVPNYCLPDLAGGPTKLLKLHGSLNWTWTKSEENKEIVVLPWLSVVRAFRGPRSGNEVHLPLGALLRSLGEHVTGQAVIVPPTWSKLNEYRGLAATWRAAAQELGTAENIYVAGFSLAESDAFFRMLYGLGTSARARLRRFWVFDPGKAQVEPRFRELLGQAAISKFRCEAMPFGTFVRRDLKEAVGLGGIQLG